MQPYLFISAAALFGGFTPYGLVGVSIFIVLTLGWMVVAACLN